MTDKTQLVNKIKNGTVIDHIPVNRGLKVLELLGSNISKIETAVIIINMVSGALDHKDILKIENRELTNNEVNKISLIAPDATLNIIRDWKVSHKSDITVPDILEDVFDCPNSNCISNANEPNFSKFNINNKNPLSLTCQYCERIFSINELPSFT